MNVHNTILISIALFLFSCNSNKKFDADKIKNEFFEQSKDAFKEFYGKDLDVKSVKLMTGTDLKSWINTNGWGTKNLPCDLSQFKGILDKGDIDPIPVALGLDDALSGQSISAVYIPIPPERINCDKEHSGYFMDNQGKGCDKWAHCSGMLGKSPCHCNCHMACGEADIDCGYCSD